MVWVWMGDPAKSDQANIVDHPYHNDPRRWPNKHDVYPIKANYTSSEQASLLARV
jgi:hypothetical protein